MYKFNIIGMNRGHSENFTEIIEIEVFIIYQILLIRRI